MFALDPVNAITSVQFYKKVAKQSGARTAGYVLYLGALFALTATIALKLRLGPQIDSTFDWLGKSVPPLEFANGRVSGSLTAPVTITHPKIPDLTLVIDLARTEPVTLSTLQQAKAMAYLTPTALYLRRQASPGEPGPAGDRLELFDFSKAGATTHYKIDAAFFQAADRLFNRVMYPVAFSLVWLLTMLWRLIVTLCYSVLLAVVMNSATQANLPYSELFNITLYAQTLVVALQMVFLFMRVPLPFGPAVSLAATGSYIWLALRAHVQPPVQPAA